MVDPGTATLICGGLQIVAGGVAHARDIIPLERNTFIKRRIFEAVRSDSYRLLEAISGTTARVAREAEDWVERAMIEIRNRGSIPLSNKLKTILPGIERAEEKLNRVRSGTYSNVVTPVASLSTTLSLLYIQTRHDLTLSIKPDFLNNFLEQSVQRFKRVFERKDESGKDEFKFAKMLFGTEAVTFGDAELLTVATKTALRTFVFYYAALCREVKKTVTLTEIRVCMEKLIPQAQKYKAVDLVQWAYDWLPVKYGSGDGEAGVQSFADTIKAQYQEGWDGKCIFEDVVFLPFSDDEKEDPDIPLREAVQQVVLVGKLKKHTGTRSIFLCLLEWVPRLPELMGIAGVAFCGPTDDPTSGTPNAEIIRSREVLLTSCLVENGLGSLSADMVTKLYDERLGKMDMAVSTRDRGTFPEHVGPKVVRIWLRKKKKPHDEKPFNCLAALDLDLSTGKVTQLKDSPAVDRSLANVFSVNATVMGAEDVLVNGERKTQFLELSSSSDKLQWVEQGCLDVKAVEGQKTAGFLPENHGETFPVFAAIPNDRKPVTRETDEVATLKLLIPPTSQKVHDLALPFAPRNVCGLGAGVLIAGNTAIDGAYETTFKQLAVKLQEGNPALNLDATISSTELLTAKSVKSDYELRIMTVCACNEVFTVREDNETVEVVALR